jgi:competence protein ComEC
MSNFIQGYMLLLLAVSTLSGTLVALQSYWSAFFIASLFLMLLVRKSSILVWISCIIVFVAACLLADLQETNRISTLTSRTPIHLLTIDSIPTIDGNSVRGFGELNNEKIIFQYRIPSEELIERTETLMPGLTCKIHGNLVEPTKNSNPNLFNYKRYLYEQDVHWILQVDSFEDCKKTDHTWKYSLIQWRYTGLKYIDEHFPAETVGMTQALVFGETGRIPEEKMNSYRELGIVHLLAISGLHVGLIFGMLYFILLRLGITRESALWVSVIFLLFYMVITGGAPPVVRASFMLIILLLFRKSRSRVSTLDSLSIVFISLLFWNPFSVFDIGFQLSFTVSYCLVLSSTVILASSVSYIIQLLKVTVVAQLSSLPIILFHFYEFSLAGFLSNLLFVPLFSLLVLPMALFTFLMKLLVFDDFYLLSSSYALIVRSVDAFSSLIAGFPFTTVVLGKPHSLTIICYALLTLNVFLQLEREKWKIPALMLCSFILMHMAWNHFSPYGEVVFIDVGQGDAILIDLPFNQGNYLIDTGGAVGFSKEEWEKKTKTFTVGEDVILPFLKSKGVTSINKLILTHGDLDHIGGAEELMGKLKVEEILITPNSHEKKEMKDIITLAKETETAVKQVKSPFKWEAGQYSFHILSPQDDEYEGNDDSLVVYSEMGGLKWLFTGDMEKKGEGVFVQSYNIKADVLKIGHHGSNTSTSDEFLEEIQPSIGVISAGRRNRFGHPHPDVIERLQRNEVLIHNTAEHGALTYRFLWGQGTFSAHHP